MRIYTIFCCLLVIVCLQAHRAHAALSLQALTSFGGGDGWLEPSEATHLQGANVQRGLVYSPTNNQLYLVDRNAGTFVRALDGNSGALVGSLDTTGVTGGTFAANMVGVGGDGAIYVGNLSTANTNEFKVYRWQSVAAAPTVAYNGLTGLARTGDTFAVIGSGAATRIVASGSGANGIAVLGTADGSNFTLTSANPIAGAAAGAFRLGMDFIDPNTVIGKSTGTAILTADLANSTSQTSAVATGTEAPLAYYSALNLLATVDYTSNVVRLYDATNFANLTLLDTKTTTTGAAITNANGVGDLSFGLGPDGALRLYVLNTNNGIQAFRVVDAVPEPTSGLVLVGMSVMGLALRRRRT